MSILVQWHLWFPSLTFRLQSLQSGLIRMEKYDFVAFPEELWWKDWIIVYFLYSYSLYFLMMLCISNVTKKQKCIVGAKYTISASLLSPPLPLFGQCDAQQSVRWRHSWRHLWPHPMLVSKMENQMPHIDAWPFSILHVHHSLTSFTSIWNIFSIVNHFSLYYGRITHTHTIKSSTKSFTNANFFHFFLSFQVNDIFIHLLQILLTHTIISSI